MVYPKMIPLYTGFDIYLIGTVPFVVRCSNFATTPNRIEQGQKGPRQGQDIPQLFYLEHVLSRKSQFGYTNVGHEADRPVRRDHAVNQNRSAWRGKAARGRWPRGACCLRAPSEDQRCLLARSFQHAGHLKTRCFTPRQVPMPAGPASSSAAVAAVPRASKRLVFRVDT